MGHSQTLGKLELNRTISDLTTQVGDGDTVSAEEIRTLRPVVSLSAHFNFAPQGQGKPSLTDEMSYVATGQSQLGITATDVATMRGNVDNEGNPVFGWKAMAMGAERRLASSIEQNYQQAKRELDIIFCPRTSTILPVSCQI